MENLVIERTYNSPEIVFNYNKGELSIKGRAHPENAESTFLPIIEWIENYSENPQPQTLFEIDLEYFNSTASKTLLKLFSDLIEAQKKTNLTIKWHYYDKDSLEIAEDFESLLGLEMMKIDAS